jgi:hypothetical protein
MIVFDLMVVLKKVIHSLRRSIVGKRKLHVQNYNWAVDQLPKLLPRVIWIYWDSPVEQAPPFVQYAIQSWRSKNPEWEVRVLDDNSLTRFITVPTAPTGRKIQGKSDAIRLALLRRHGGIWVDATCACARPLDQWLPPLMNSGFFAFPDTYPGRIIQSWFLAAAPENELVVEWANLALPYYSKRGRIRHYFWVMYLFEYLIMTNRRAAVIWASVPKVPAKGALLLKRMITQKDLAEPIPDCVDLGAIPMHKLSSSTRSDNSEFLEAIRQNRDIDLRKVALRLLQHP